MNKVPPKTADMECLTKTNRTRTNKAGSLWQILCLLLCPAMSGWAAAPKPRTELGGDFKTDLVMRCADWSIAKKNVEKIVLAEKDGKNFLKYRNIMTHPFEKTFDGNVKFVGAPGVLAIISDDGCTVKVKPRVPGAVWTELLGKSGKGQKLDLKAFETLPFLFKPGTIYDMQVKYSQTYYNPKSGRPDIDGATLYACLLPVEMKEVSFGGTKYRHVESDDGATTYTAPQWVDENGDSDAADEGEDEHNDAVAYTRNSKPKIGTKMKIIGLPSGVSIQMRAKGPGSVQMPATAPAVAGEEVTLPLVESTGTLVNTIKHYTHKDATKAFSLDWELSFDSGTTWSKVATTKHTVYVTLADPKTRLRQETLFEIGCRNADGIDTEANVTDAVWNEFPDLVVKRVDGTQLTYYRDWETNNTDTSRLLSQGDGICTAWAHFFVDLLKLHGIDQENEGRRIYAIKGRESILINNRQFPATGIGRFPGYPYFNIYPGNNFEAVAGNAYVWRYADVTDLGGVPGQVAPNPRSIFDRHHVVVFNNTYYDPSYGRTYGSLQEFEDKEVAGFCLYPMIGRVKESEVNLDLNGDGKITDFETTIQGFLIRKNPPGADLQERPINY